MQSLYAVSDEQAEYQIRDRLSFMCFLGLGLGLGLEDRVPDATTLWLYCEALVKTGLVEQLFAMFDAHLRAQGYRATGGQILDATIVEVPRQQNTAKETETIKAGGKPEGWTVPKTRQKDRDARWTKKNGQSFFGYKNYVSIDRKHKLVRRYWVTDAARHDSQEIGKVLDPSNTSGNVWADSAYRSAEIEAMLAEDGYRSHVHRRAKRGHPLGACAKAANTERVTIASVPR